MMVGHAFSLQIRRVGQSRICSMESLHEVYRCLPETYYAALPLGLNGGSDVVAGFGVPYVA